MESDLGLILRDVQSDETNSALLFPLFSTRQITPRQASEVPRKDNLLRSDRKSCNPISAANKLEKNSIN